ncbi:hypothetical protein DC74_7297 [Streptomyces noursei]|uniref:Uncharacterized protein n=1 Tax=Streptomyces noursei TaxID=1971 RepID=A0A059WIU9_STRNR|nr:hypothetical protein DC74_7297 [Streptomyces noursei]GCB95458.1 hypothetical protein SALB_08263 [Streptomyces noursei]
MMRRRTFPLIALIAILASSGLSACSVLHDGEPKANIGVPQAAKQVDSILDNTFKAVRPELKWREGRPTCRK